MAGQENVELTSPHKHTQNTLTCGTTLTENFLEIGRRTPTQAKLQERSLCNQVGWGKKGIRQRPMPLRGIRKEEKVHTGGFLPQGVSRSAHNLDIPVLGSRAEETSPLPAGKSTETERRAGEVQTLLVRSAHMLAC